MNHFYIRIMPRTHHGNIRLVRHTINYHTVIVSRLLCPSLLSFVSRLATSRRNWTTPGHVPLTHRQIYINLQIHTTLHLKRAFKHEQTTPIPSVRTKPSSSPQDFLYSATHHFTWRFRIYYVPEIFRRLRLDCVNQDIWGFHVCVFVCLLK